jgi:3-isopropylmalate/(R)-2-methylmalate dehydratase small subunit
MGEVSFSGRVWKFGDNIGVEHFDVLKAGRQVLALEQDKSSSHVSEGRGLTFPRDVRSGDFIVAGRRFGAGKHHRDVIGVIRGLGISGFLASSLDPMFQREAIDLGIPAIACREVPSNVENGDLLEFDLRTGRANNLTKNLSIMERPAPEIILSILEAGGVEPYTLGRLGFCR